MISGLRSKLLACLAALGSVVACGAERTQFHEKPDEVPFPSPDSGVTSGPNCNVVRCSRDLKKVLEGCDGAEEVLAECGPDQGCGDGRCVDACSSAELSQGSAGCAFYTLPPDYDRVGTAGSCFAAMIANTWDRPVTLQAELGNDPLDISKSAYYAENTESGVAYTRIEGPLPPGKVAVIFLSQRPNPDPSSFKNHVACPLGVAPAFRDDPIGHRTTRTRAFKLVTDAPVSAYSIYPYGGAAAYYPTATLLLPVSSWGTNYLAVNAWASPSIGNPMLQIVASQEDTEVRIRPVVDIADGNGVVGTAKGTTKSWTLSRGEVLQITQPEELTGSPIETNKPVAVFGGSESTYIPAGVQAADTTQQQIPPLVQWGNAYALVPYRPRTIIGPGMTAARERVAWRFVGAANDTKLTYEPAKPLGAPETLEAGQVVSFMTEDLAMVRSQDKAHPFYVAIFMTGADLAIDGTDGDPDFVNIVPSDQFLDRYVFFVDHTFPQTNLTIVRRKTARGFLPVKVDCVGEVSDFRALDASGEYEFAWVKLTERGNGMTYGTSTCGYGRHEAVSDGPFSLTVWGTGYCASYGYAGGMGMRPINELKIPVVF